MDQFAPSEPGCPIDVWTILGLRAGTPDASYIAIPQKICHSHTETLGNPMEGAES